METFHFVFTILHIELFLLTGSVFGNGPNHSSVVATEGDNVHLLCNATVRAPVWWKYQRNNKDLPTYLSMGSVGTSDVVPKYRPRFELDSETYTLTIRNVSISDSGLYHCVDNDGFGQTHATWLTVDERNDSVSFEDITSSPDDTPMATSRVIMIIILVLMVIIAAVIIVFIVVKRFKDMSSHPDEVSELHEIIPLTDCPTLLSIKRVIEELTEIVEPDYELLDHLISLQVLKCHQCSEIRALATVQKRASMLLDIIVTKTEKQCRDFLVALTRSDQQHVVNFIQHPKDTAERYGNVHPLDESQLLHMDVNLPQLTELIDCDGELLTTLVAKRSITRQQKSEMDTIMDPVKRNRKLMEILKRRSVAQLHTFVKCLVANHKGHLAPLIMEKGVIISFDSTLEKTSVDNVGEAENQIVSRFMSLLSRCDDNRSQQVMSLLEDQFKDFLQNCDVDMRARLLSMLVEFQEKTRSLGEDVDLVALKKQNSIGSYFFCRTYQSLQSLQKLYENGELCQILELIFTILLHGTDRLCIKTHWWIQNNNYGRSLNYLQTRGSSLIVEGIMNQFQFPIEVLEMLLVKTFVVIFIRRLRTDGLCVSEAEHLAYSTLSSVCCDWWQTLNGWPQSNTRHWVRHRLQHLVEYVCLPYLRCPQLVKQLDTTSYVRGVTQMDDKIFVVCSQSDKIRVFGLKNEQLGHIKVIGLKLPWDIVACSETRSLYVVDWSPGCVWRVSTDGRVDKFLPTTTSSSFSPWSLSVTSGRLLVTTRDVMLLYGADGAELKRLSFTDMSKLRHAVETSRGTFVFCHHKPQPQVVEVDGDGRIISVYNNQQQLTLPCHLSIDSEGKMFIADSDKHHILLLTSDLQLDRVLLDTEHNQLAKQPWRLFYVQQTRQLLVGSELSPVVQVFAVI